MAPRCQRRRCCRSSRGRGHDLGANCALLRRDTPVAEMLERKRQLVVLGQRLGRVHPRAARQFTYDSCALDVAECTDGEESRGTGEDVGPSMTAADLAGIAHVLVVLEVAHHPVDGVPEEDRTDSAHAGTVALGFAEAERGLGDELGRDRAVRIHRHHRVVVGETGKDEVEDLVESPCLLVEVVDGRHHDDVVTEGDHSRQVGAAIVDDDDLVGDAGLGGERLQGFADQRRFVMCRNEYDDPTRTWSPVIVRGPASSVQLQSGRGAAARTRGPWLRRVGWKGRATRACVPHP